MQTQAFPRLLHHLFESGIVRASDSKLIRLQRGVTLQAHHAPPFAHVLLSGVVSTTIRLNDGTIAAVDMHSAGDLLESQHLMGMAHSDCQVSVIVYGEAMRIPFPMVTRAFAESANFRKAACERAAFHALQSQRISVCNCFHSLESRLARYVLMVGNLTGQDRIPLTQECLSQQLGVQRTTVSLAAGVLRRRGAVTLNRGSICISDPGLLESMCCECYATMRRLQEPGFVHATHAEHTRPSYSPAPLHQAAS